MSIFFYVFHRDHTKLSKRKSITTLCTEAGSITPQIFLPDICRIHSLVSLPAEIFHVIRQFTIELNCSYGHKGFPYPLLSFTLLPSKPSTAHPIHRESKLFSFSLQLLFKHLKNTFVFHFSLLPVLLTKPL